MSAERQSTPRLDMRELWAKVQDNNGKWHACPKHHFSHQGPWIIGQKIRCDACGAEASLVDIGNYIRGYVAAGGDARDVMPAWGEGR